MEPATRRRSFWGWGDEESALDAEQRDALGGMIASRFGGCELRELTPPRLDDLSLPAPRFTAPEPLAALFSHDPRERASHTYGKAFRDVVRGLEGDYRAAPDAVAFPASEADLVRILDHCASRGLAAIPYGGGSSAVGGVEARLPGEWPGVVSIDLRGLGAVLEIDQVSRAARVQGGIYGPALEGALRPHGLTLRHFPQSFEFSTLGGWIATRSGGHFATLATHIDDFVEALRVVTPAGTLETRRLPGSGAGPSPDRLFMGSEGALGIITEAWVRLQARPRFRASTTARFPEFSQGAAAARDLAQSGLYPSNCRLLDAQEAMNNGAGDGTRSLLLVAFESADHPLDPWMDRALAICRERGGEAREGAGRTRGAQAAAGGGGSEPWRAEPPLKGAAEAASARDLDDAGGAWRSAFLKAPYLRDALIRVGLIVETFETAITWDRFDDFHAAVSAATRDAAVRICGQAIVTCRLTHVYPDGAAPYFTVIAPARAGSQIAQWDEIKAAASEVILGLGGTITHHHAVGRDHRRGYDRQRPDLFARALAAVKASLDPAGVMNPGVLL